MRDMELGTRTYLKAADSTIARRCVWEAQERGGLFNLGILRYMALMLGLK